MTPFGLDIGDRAVVESALRGALMLFGMGAAATVALPVAARLRPAAAHGAATGDAPKTADSRSLWVRYGSAFGTTAVFFVASYLGGVAFTAMILALVLLVLREFWRMAVVAGVPPFSILATGAAIALVFGAAAFGPAALGPALALGLGCLFAGALRSPLEAWPARLGVSVLGILYVGLQATYMLLLRQAPGGYAHFCLYFAVIQVADAFAFFGGRAFGRRLIAPTISPKKTWEGCAVGLVAGIAAAELFSFGAPGLSHLAIAGVGAAMFVLSLLGDLVASAFKRAAGLKDFGQMLPEQGGLLDRFDGYLFAAPATYYLFQWLGP